MSQYVSIILDNQEMSRINKGLRLIIEYIGGREKTGISFDRDEYYYQQGVTYINKKARGHHKRAIDRLVKPDKELWQCVYDGKSIKNHWRLHKKKTTTILEIIYSRLAEDEEKQLMVLFGFICNNLHVQDGAYAIGSPYYYRLDMDNYIYDTSKYTEKESIALENIRDMINIFKDYYPR